MTSSFYSNPIDKNSSGKTVDLTSNDLPTTIADLGGIEVEDLAQLDDVALKALIDKYAPTGKDSPVFISKVKKEITEATSTYQTAKNALNQGLHKITDSSKLAQGQAILKEIDSLLAKLKTDMTTVGDECAAIIKRTVDLSDGSSAKISSSSLKFDGETYTYLLGGSTADNSLPTDPVNPLDGITSDKTINGAVIKDFNGDGLKNDKDITDALEKAKVDLKSKQNIVINTGHWTLISADDAASSYSFKVTDKDGKECIVTFNNASDCIFDFNSGLSDAEVQNLKEMGWSDKLLKQCYGKDYSKSLYEKINGKATDSIKKLNAIDGYATAHDNMAQFDPYSEGPLSPALQKTAQDAIDTLFKIYAEGGKVSEKAQSAWGNILSGWNKATPPLSKADQRNLVEHIVAAIAIGNKDLMGLLVGSTIAPLEAILAGGTGEPSTAQAKTIILILETQCMGDTGPLSGPLDLTKLFASEDIVDKTDPSKTTYPHGNWANHTTNLAAIDQFTTLVNKMGGLLTGHEKEITTLEKKSAAPLTLKQQHDPKYKSASDEWNAIPILDRMRLVNSNPSKLTNWSDWPNNLMPDGNPGPDSFQTKWNTFIYEGNVYLFKADGTLEPDIVGAIAKCAGYGDPNLLDDVAFQFILFVNTYCSDEFKTYFFTTLANDEEQMYALTNGVAPDGSDFGDSNAPNKQAALDILAKYAF